jgi:hypothetical protein
MEQLKSLKRRGDNVIETPESRMYRDVYVSAIRKGCDCTLSNKLATEALGHYMAQFQSDYIGIV